MNLVRSSPATGGSGRVFTAWARSRNRWSIASMSSWSAIAVTVLTVGRIRPRRRDQRGQVGVGLLALGRRHLDVLERDDLERTRVDHRSDGGGFLVDHDHRSGL